MTDDLIYYDFDNFREFDTRNDMIVYFIKTIESPTILEIGIFKGEFFDYIFNNCNPHKLIGVDLFEGICGSGDQNGNNFVYYDIGQSYIELTEKYKNNTNVELIKNNSVAHLIASEDNYYDCIYIDGDHSYEGVKKDLENGYKKIKNGGFIMGHDYEINSTKTPNKYDFGVKKAVTEFCQKYNQKIIAKGMDGCVSFCIKVTK